MGILYNLGSTKAKVIGYTLCFYLCHAAAVTIPQRIVAEVQNKVVYVAEGLGRSAFNYALSHGPQNDRDSMRALAADLVAEHCRLKGGCLEDKVSR